jgi:hypothetical protein
VVGHQQAACAAYAAHDATPTLALDVRHRFAGQLLQAGFGAGLDVNGGGHLGPPAAVTVKNGASIA